MTERRVKVSLQVLVATMNQHDYSLLDKMHIDSNVIVANQTNFDSVDRFLYKNREVTYLNFNERGVGLNRNNALMRATDEFVLFADDDEILVEGYESIVLDAFLNMPEADVLILNIENLVEGNSESVKKVNWFNYMRYGAVRIAARTNKIKEQGILFNLCFGGGAVYSHGEDTLFLTECLRKGLRIYTYPVTIAKITELRESSWFKGYDLRYFADTGVLYKTISKRFWKILCLQDAIRHRKSYKQSIKDTYLTMVKGM